MRLIIKSYMRWKIFLVLLCCFRVGNSIRCFDCSSVNNTMCVDPHLYDPESVKKFLRVSECTIGLQASTPDGDYQFFCRKIHQTILHKHFEPEIRVTRGCGWKRYSHDCYRADNEDHLETVCQCFTDECNGAHARDASSLSAALITFCASILFFNLK